MNEPIRTIAFTAGADGLTPRDPQFAGVQGDHNAAMVVFTLAQELIDPGYTYRVEFTDAAGGYDTTGPLAIRGNTVSCPLPASWTRTAGVGNVRLCAAALNAAGEEEQVIHTLAGRLHIAAREGAEEAETGRGELAGLTERTRLAAQEAERAADWAFEAAENAAWAAVDTATADSRYARAIEASATLIGGAVTLEDADDAAFSHVLLEGATVETGEGDKGPDNPYTITGAEPSTVTAFGRNQCPPTFYQGAYTTQLESRIHSELIPIVPHMQYVFSVAAEYAALNVYFLGADKVGLTWLQSANNTAKQLRFVPNKNTYRYAVLVVSYPDQTTPITPDAPVSAQLELASAPTAYEPYAGQTVSLPALDPLYGDGAVNDEYDAATGVETRRWGKLVLDGTTRKLTAVSSVWANLLYTNPLPGVQRPSDNSQTVAYSISHYEKATWNAVTTGHLSGHSAIGQGGELGLVFAGAIDEANAYLAAQAAAGTPVTVLYQLAEPVVTRHDPLRIPTYPGCTNLTLDVPAGGSVRYPLSAARQWAGKADWDETADTFAGALIGTASGAVAAMEDVSPVGALRRAAVLGATTETGEGDKGPDNPYTLAGVQPTKVTVCGKNLLDLSAFTLKTDGYGSQTAKYDGGKIIVTSADNYAATVLNFDVVFPPAAYCVSLNGTKRLISDSDEIPKAISNPTYKKYGREYFSNTDATTLCFTATKPFRVGFTCEPGDSVVYPQIELDDTATPYEPYTGQTIPLPTLAPLYGDGTVCDEYDASTGVETRRWRRVELDGTRTWSANSIWNATAPDYFHAYLRLPNWLQGQTTVMVDHFPVFYDTYQQHFEKEICFSGTYETALYLFVRKDRLSSYDVNGLKAYLAAQAAAGTPVTVLYRLAEPVVTRHGSARILPPAPVCRVFADAGTVEASYPQDLTRAIGRLEAALTVQRKKEEETI